jgi:hypothetical protein
MKTLCSTTKFITVLLVGIGMFASFTHFASAESYYYTPTYQTQNTAQIQSLLNQLYVLIAQLQKLQSQQGYYGTHTYTKPVTTYPVYYNSNYDVEVSTEDSDQESDDTVTLYGEVDLDSAPYALVSFEYGTDSDLDEETATIKKTSDGSFSIEVDDVDDDQYYFRAVATDPSGDTTYGSIKGFDFNGNNNDDDDDNDGDTPEVTTDDAEDIDNNSAEINGEIDMNDFENGVAFFVYGEDDGDVEDVEDEDSYNDISSMGEDLQKVLLSSNLDDNRTFSARVQNLNEDTEIFYRICVAYEDEDNDDVIECGSVESFETDNN